MNLTETTSRRSSSGSTHATLHWTLVSMLAIAACAVRTKPAASGTTVESRASADARPGQAPSTLPDLRPREELPLEVREMLTARMDRHGTEMTALMLCVVMLEYDLMAKLASKLADEPKLGRPAAGEKGTLNAMLPAGFFVYQDALSSSARVLASAATERDDPRVLASFSDLTKTCVGCHTTYRAADFASFEHDEPGDALPCDEGDEACEGADQGEDTTNHTHL